MREQVKRKETDENGTGKKADQGDAKVKGKAGNDRRTAARRKSVYEASAIGWGNEI